MPESGCNLFDGTKVIGPVRVSENCGPQSGEFRTEKGDAFPALQPRQDDPCGVWDTQSHSPWPASPEHHLLRCAQATGGGRFFREAVTAASKGIQVEETGSVTQDTKALRGMLDNSGTSELSGPSLWKDRLSGKGPGAPACLSPFYTPSPGVSLGLGVLLTTSSLPIPFSHLHL